MKSKKYLSSLIVSTAVLVMNTLSLIQPGIAQQLTSVQQKLLKSVGMKIAVPSYLPSGFKLLAIQTEATSNDFINYRLIYGHIEQTTGKEYCFAIEGTNGGVGDLVGGQNSYVVNSPLLGRSTLEYGDYGIYNRKLTLLSNWLGNSSFYRFTGSGTQAALSNCDNISPREAVRVIESLQYLEN